MKKELIKDNYYRAVNHDWFQKAKINQDKAMNGTFSILADKNEKLYKKEVLAIIEDYKNNKLTDPVLINFAKLHMQVQDFATLKTNGVAPVKKVLDKIMSLKNLQDLENHFKDLYLMGADMPLYFTIGQDFINPRIYILDFESPALILPDKSYYAADHPKKEHLLRVYRSMASDLLKKLGHNPSEIQRIIQHTLEFDELIMQYTMTNLERVRYTERYNLTSIKELKSKCNLLNLQKIAQSLVKKPVENVNVIYLPFMNNLNSIYNYDTFYMMRDYMYLSTLITFTPYLDSKTANTGKLFKKAVYGIKKNPTRVKTEIRLTGQFFAQYVATIIAKRIFSPEAKKDVENKVQTMIEIFKSRIQNMDWMSKQTKEKALIKLNALGVHIGYPEEVKPYFNDFKIKSNEEGATLVDNIIHISQVMKQYDLDNYLEQTNDKYWSMQPMEVNAYFHPFYNHIVFPAGILQAPFYSIKQTSSQNYGAIGAVIAHEITHAFDNNGAQFDEKGSMNMWWTEEDFAKFKELGQKMINLFDGREFEHGKCNGTLTVSENIADAGGISCAYQASKNDPNHNDEEFFSSWATSWKMLIRPELAKDLIVRDPHAPAELRANIQLANLKEFQDFYKIKPNDKMYIGDEERVKIW